MSKQALPHPHDVALGKQIRLARDAAGLTQDAVAIACGISFQQLQKYERGTNRVSFSRLVEIANAVGVPVTELIPWDIAKPGSGTKAPEYLSLVSEPYALELLRAFASIASKETKRALVRALEAIAKG